ncbi:LRR receptor-like serine/threonine-protein kinase FLS2 [Vigna unguiculata]|uniref:LRR receptor-like serine/threonine-protein kinase FLS2 n=1 Tax=Vigna unguiculata TaxID=3917 RepID=A0A4D6MSY5_VIGUN|nr:LRR receptor-like serine/threonine-protein kinase FLS2 [Vigna unguiculata]
MLLLLKNNLIFNPTISKKLTLWNQNEDCCQWNGVTCKEGRVVALDLSEESISGRLLNSTVLFGLQYLQSLNLAFNNFSSVIPSELCKLNNLRYLNFSNAGFEGQIPNEMFHLRRRLVILDLSSSISSPHSLKLDKPNIAMLLQNLTEITELYLDGITISAKGQEWFHALSSLHNLRVLSMSSCNMSGPIHASLAKLLSLTVLNLSNNSMSSSVPDSLKNLSNLVILQLRSCGLNGSFPKDIFLMPSLEVLDISDNQDLMGSLPNFQPRGSLRDLNLSETSFTGKLPGAISNLKHIDISYCQFNGTLPSSMSELTQLVYLDLSSNNFSGTLPSFNMSKNLTYLSLSHNSLMGVLPSNHFEGLKNLVNIDLGFNFFKGTLPSSLLKLPYLRELKLPFNQLTGLLDESVMTSPTLEMLDLGSNNLEGPIPLSIFNLRTLRVIQLNLNKFNGTLQLDMIRRLSNLTTLCLSHNNLSVDIYSRNDHDPSPFPALRNIMLASCKLRGIPSFVKNQSTLLYLDLADNEIQGTIPYWIWQLEYLLHLDLSKNFLTKLEGNVWNLSSNLMLLDLSSNQLQGPLPFLPRLVNYMDYSNNRFNSVIPADIGNRLPFISVLSLSNNSFQGQIPESFVHASNLSLMDLSHNNFDGTIPKCFAKLSSTLRVLNFGGNKLQGYIPDTLSTSCSLQLLDLNDNLLEGTIPTSLAYCQKLQVVNLRRNLLTDKFPCFLSKISTLRIMDLPLNKLHGSIGCSKSRGEWEMLHMVDVAFNNFSGAIPGALLNNWKAMMRDNDNVGPELGHLFIDIIDNYDPKNFKDLLSHLDKTIVAKLAKIVANVPRSILDQGSSDTYQIDLSQYQNSILITNKGHQIKLDKIQRAFTYVDMSSNNFQGPIPIEIMQFKAMMALNLSNNALSGHIPSSIENLKNLESLDLSNNSLCGEIPRELASLNFLAYLNLSNNDLVGEIPKGTQIQTFDGDSFEGNEKLCGPPLTRNCSNIGMPTPETHQSHSKSSIDWSLLSAELGFIFGFGVFILPLLFWKRWSFWYSKHVDEMLHKIIPQLDFSYEHRRGQTCRTLRRSFQIRMLSVIHGGPNDEVM